LWLSGVEHIIGMGKPRKTFHPLILALASSFTARAESYLRVMAEPAS
jgi:hypothetical protein